MVLSDKDRWLLMFNNHKTVHKQPPSELDDIADFLASARCPTRKGISSIFQGGEELEGMVTPFLDNCKRDWPKYRAFFDCLIFDEQSYGLHNNFPKQVPS